MKKMKYFVSAALGLSLVAGSAFASNNTCSIKSEQTDKLLVVANWAVDEMDANANHADAYFYFEKADGAQWCFADGKSCSIHPCNEDMIANNYADCGRVPINKAKIPSDVTNLIVTYQYQGDSNQSTICNIDLTNKDVNSIARIQVDP